MALDSKLISDILEHHEGMIKMLDNATQANPKKYHWVFYEDLFEDETIDSCCEFLNLQTNIRVQPNTFKQNPPSVYNQLANCDEIDKLFGEKFGELGSNNIPDIWKDIKSFY